MSEITQLFEHLEMFSEGDPSHHTLFVLGRSPGVPDQTLLIDPPADVTQRFDLAAQTAGSPHGPWRLSNSPALATAIPTAFLITLGLAALDALPAA